jgi:ATP-dependent DNA helicase RecG
MFLRELTQSLSTLKGAGPSVCAKLARMGLHTVADLLLHVPRGYEDRSRAIPFRETLSTGMANTVGVVAEHEWFGYGRMKTLKLLVDDGTARAALVCFNRPFLAERHPVGSRVRVTGRFSLRYNELQSSSFEVEYAAEGQGPEAGVLPVYPLTEGLAQGTVRKLVSRALSEYGRRVEDELPLSVRAARDLPAKAEALVKLHGPAAVSDSEEARRALAYEELFYLQIMVRRRAHARAERPADRSTSGPSDRADLRSRLLERLPFRLTPDQQAVVAEIVRDMEAPRPMARLLQGDVGSGKTLVAFLAALKAIESGGQAALMAPTELLARQHAQTAARLLEPLGVRLAFLTGNLKDASRRPLLEALKTGEVDLVLGTHALFSDDVAYRRLALAIVDEQHRFGVLQRLALSSKGGTPDLLMMTATPIPRTLALTVYGDLEVSTIRTMPPGRKTIVTHLARHGNETKVYEFIRREMAAGRQAYFVYPLIEGADGNELKDAQGMAALLREKVYPGVSGGLIHSRIPDDEKRATMEAFTRGELRYLVATSVVEVGVDVANATCMVVEHAERFGLAALHQLRGRVGRGEAQSYCFLVYSKELTEEGKRRLMAMKETSDGFALAEEDLRIRGPGEITGTAQSGSLRLLFADPARDSGLLEQARRDASAIVEEDPGFLLPEHRVLREVLERASPFPAEVAGR